MARWFLRGLRRGVLTTRYPTGAIDPWTRDLRTPPAFHGATLTQELARGLVAACPSGALACEDGELIVDLGRCTACGRCVAIGEGSVTPSGEFLLASGDRRALIKRVAIGGGS